MKTRCYVNDGFVQMFIWWLGPFSAWFFSGIPSPIYREGVWMVWGGICGGFIRTGMGVGTWLTLTRGTQKWIPSVVVCITGKFFLLPSIFWNNQGQWEVLLQNLLFAIFGKSWILHMASGSLFGDVSMWKLTSKPTTIPFAKFLWIIVIIRNNFMDLECWNANSDWCAFGLCIMASQRLQTKAK